MQTCTTCSTACGTQGQGRCTWVVGLATTRTNKKRHPNLDTQCTHLGKAAVPEPADELKIRQGERQPEGV